MQLFGREHILDLSTSVLFVRQNDEHVRLGDEADETIHNAVITLMK
jgi:hypothetical protein